MKIKTGFVTNSSSTNFIIISKKELTVEYLYEKFGFKLDSPIRELGLQLCRNLLKASYDRNVRHCDDINTWNYDTIKKIYGEDTANVFEKMQNEGPAYINVGSTGTDSDDITSFFTCDFAEINDPDFYVNAKNCIW